MVEGAATGVPTAKFRGCSLYSRHPKPGDEGFYLLRASGDSEDPLVSIHFFVGDELEVALALDRLRPRPPAPSALP